MSEEATNKISRRHPRRVQDGAHTCGYRASQQGRFFKRNIPADRYRTLGWHDDVGAEATGVQHHGQRLAAERDPWRACPLDVLAKIASATKAVPATPTFCLPVDHDVVARSRRYHALPHRLNHTCAFVP